MASTFNPDDAEQGVEQATGNENAGGEVLADGPADRRKNDDIYQSYSHKHTGYDRRRTDLRALDEHCSWREVYAALHCPTEW